MGYFICPAINSGEGGAAAVWTSVMDSTGLAPIAGELAVELRRGTGAKLRFMWVAQCPRKGGANSRSRAWCWGNRNSSELASGQPHLYYKNIKSGEQMPKRLIRFNLPQDQSKKTLFLRDSSCDFILVLEKKIFPLHKQLLGPSEYFAELVQANKKSIAINNHFSAHHSQTYIQCFEKILGCFYGIEAAFERHLIMTHLLDIMSLLRVREFNQQLEADMRNNFDEYGLFNLFYLSRRLGLKDIEEKCLHELIDEEFEQINYNKYDLLQLSPQLFVFVLKQHEKLKACKAITGLGCNKIRLVCQEYNKITNEAIDAQEIFNYGKRYQLEALSGENSEQEFPSTRKRNATWTSMPEKQNKNKKLEREIFVFQSAHRTRQSEQKTPEVMKIKLINSEQQQIYNSKVAQDSSSESKKKVDKDRQSSPEAIIDLDNRIREFQEKSKSAHRKMEILREKMLQMTQHHESVQDKGEQIMFQALDQPAVSNQGDFQKQGYILPEMAILNKNEDLCSDSDI